MTAKKPTSSEADDQPPDFLSGIEAALFLGVSKATITKLCQKGELSGFTIGRRLSITKASLIDYIRRHSFGDVSALLERLTSAGNGDGNGELPRPRPRRPKKDQ